MLNGRARLRVTGSFVVLLIAFARAQIDRIVELNGSDKMPCCGWTLFIYNRQTVGIVVRILRLLGVVEIVVEMVECLTENNADIEEGAGTIVPRLKV
jgi:hypothetical protein